MNDIGTVSTSNTSYIKKQIASLRNILRYSLKKALRKLNLVIAIYHTRDNYQENEWFIEKMRINQLLSDIKRIETQNESVKKRLCRLKKTLDISTKYENKSILYGCSKKFVKHSVQKFT